MLLSKTVIQKWNSKTKKHYESKGYIYTRMGDEFEVKVEDLTDGSHALVDVQCDCADCTTPINKPTRWKDYKKCIHEDGNYYCRECGRKLFAGNNIKKAKLQNNKSFGYWLIKNLPLKQAIEIIIRWDDKLNGCDIREVNYGSRGKDNKGYWFKCSRGLHPSELKNISNFTRSFIKGLNVNLDCNVCNSIGQHLLDTYGENGINDYWDYEKNNALGLNPFKIAKSTDIKVFIFCQKHSYHGSYLVLCASFSKENGTRCPFCSNRNGKVHPLDSLGQYIIDNYGEDFLNKIWSEKNEKSAFEYAPHSKQEVYWKCLDGKHIDYYRNIKDSTFLEFRCPECQFSKGEKRIEDYLINNNFIKDINYIPQKEFGGLIGLGGGNLSYDFYLLEPYNLLIEYQGLQHEKYVRGFHKSKKDFEKQQEHDRRKREYAEENNIRLLPIWYYDYENIEKILDKELREYKEAI